MKIPGVLCAAAYVLMSIMAYAQYKIEVLDSNTAEVEQGVVQSKISFRGLSVVDDQTIWASGSRGTVALSTDGGKKFRYTQLKGYEKSDFRDIEAFDSKCAIVMSSGTPAYVLKTTDGGQTWKEVYQNSDSACFLDALDFWDKKRGMIIGDPVNGHFVLLKTNDGGETWMQLDTSVSPAAVKGEAVFAASGTSLRCWGDHNIVFVSGGAESALLYQLKKTTHWERSSIPISKGQSGRGAFSVLPFADKSAQQFFLVSGGDYMKDTLAENNFAIYRPEAQLWSEPGGIYALNGYRSCIEEVAKNVVISCGTTGVDLAIVDLNGVIAGKWKLISDESFHVVRKAKKGKAVFLAGSKGKIGKLVY